MRDACRDTRFESRTGVAWRRSRRRAFTLIELLVALGVIGVLIGILVPALSGALGAARDVKCIANLKQISLAWIVFGNEHGRFPSGDPKYFDIEGTDGEVLATALTYQSVELTRDWGGVDWFSDDTPLPFDDARRLINPYLGSDSQDLSTLSEIFLCPRDNGLIEDRGPWFTPRFVDAIEYRWGAKAGTTNMVALSKAPNPGDTIYSVSGTSYRANDWIWAPIGNKFGWDAPDQISRGQATTGANRPIDVEEPSEFVVVGDWGSMVASRLPHGSPRISYHYGWWHGMDACNIAFFDGSARRTEIQPGYGATHDYTFYFDRTKHVGSRLVAWVGRYLSEHQ